MFGSKLLKLLFRKFKWKIIFLFFLTFLINYILFLIRFNLVNNLSFSRSEYRGYFFFLFEKYEVIEKIVGENKFVNWNKLLLILFLLYFPLKIFIHLTLNYWKQNYQKEVEIFLTKRLLSYAIKNKHLMTEKIDEKIYIINDIVPKFSRHFIDIHVEAFEIIISIFFAIVNLYYLINSRSFNLIPFIVIFILINMIWFTLFNFIFSQSKKENIAERNNCQDWEKSQIKVWLEKLVTSKHYSQNTKELVDLLDKNYQKTTNINFASTLYRLPIIMIPGTVILFLFLYYQLYCKGEGGLGWDAYFVANNLQIFVRKIEKTFSLLSSVSSFRGNHQKLKIFF